MLRHRRNGPIQSLVSRALGRAADAVPRPRRFALDRSQQGSTEIELHAFERRNEGSRNPADRIARRERTDDGSQMANSVDLRRLAPIGIGIAAVSQRRVGGLPTLPALFGAHKFLADPHGVDHAATINASISRKEASELAHLASHVAARSLHEGTSVNCRDQIPRRDIAERHSAGVLIGTPQDDVGISNSIQHLRLGKPPKDSGKSRRRIDGVNKLPRDDDFGSLRRGMFRAGSMNPFEVRIREHVIIDRNDVPHARPGQQGNGRRTRPARADYRHLGGLKPMVRPIPIGARQPGDTRRRRRRRQGAPTIGPRLEPLLDKEGSTYGRPSIPEPHTPGNDPLTIDLRENEADDGPSRSKPPHISDKV
jgi:hypothetical protein